MKTPQAVRAVVSAGLAAFAAAAPFLLSAQSVAPPPVRPPSAVAGEEAVQLSVFTVTSDKDIGYGATNSVGGSRVNIPLRELPKYVISLNEEFLKDLGAVQMLDALTYVSGVTVAGDGRGDNQYSLRGQAQGGVAYRDGLPDREFSADVAVNDTATYDRIEVIKGPAGVLYGSHNIGGIVNRTSKLPKSKRETLLQFNGSLGTDEYVRAMLDTTGPIDQEGRTAYRFVAAVRDGQMNFGGIDDRQSYLGVLRHAFGTQKQTRVWGRFLHYSFNLNRDIGVGFVDRGGEVPNFQRGNGRQLAQFPLDAESPALMRNYEVGAETSFRMLGGEWSGRVIVRKNDARGDKTPSYAGGAITALDATGRVLGTNLTVGANDPRVADWRTVLIARNFEGFSRNETANVDLVGRFDLGPTNHTFIANGSLGHSENRRVFDFWNARFPNAPAAAANTFSLMRPGPDLAGVTFATIKAGDITRFNAFNQESHGWGQSVGVQDNIAILKKRLIGVGGIRLDRSRGEGFTVNPDHSTVSRGRGNYTDWVDTHNLGLIGQPIEGVSVFAQRATTFNYGSGLNPVTGQLFPDQIGLSRELGAKFELFDRRVIMTVSKFKMTLSGIVINVVNPPELGGGTRREPAGTQKTDGWETDIAWQPTPNLRLLAAYSDVTSVNEAGIAFRGAPQTPVYQFFGKYSLARGPLKGIGVSVGYRHNGRKPGDALNTFQVPENDTFDLGFYYAPGRRWDVQLNVLNLTDEDDLLTTVAASNITLMLERTYRLTVNYRF